MLEGAPNGENTNSRGTVNDSAAPGDGEQASPPRLIVNVADLRRRLGQRQVEPIEVVLPRQQVLASHTTARPVTGEVTVESIERGVSVHGHVSFAWEADCRRCLDTTGDVTTIEIDEIFQVDAPIDSDINDFDGDQIDLVPIVRDAVGLSLPLAPLCREDCAGPDPDRYPTLAHDADTRERDEDGNLVAGDPRWAGLDQLDLGTVDDN